MELEEAVIASFGIASVVDSQTAANAAQATALEKSIVIDIVMERQVTRLQYITTFPTIRPPTSQWLALIMMMLSDF